MDNANLTVMLEVPAAFAGESAIASAQLKIEGLLRSKDAMTLRVFIEDPQSDANTPTEENASFVGAIYLYGHGQEGPPRDERAADQRAPYDMVLDLSADHRTRAVRARSEKAKLAVTLVPVDAHDEPLPAAAIRFNRLSLHVNDSQFGEEK